VLHLYHIEIQRLVMNLLISMENFLLI